MTYSRRAMIAGCTPRQVEVIRLLEAGYSLRDTALIIGISHPTVQEHRDKALRQIRAHEETLESDAA